MASMKRTKLTRDACTAHSTASPLFGAAAKRFHLLNKANKVVQLVEQRLRAP